MEEKRPIYFKRLIASFIIATLFFVGGFLISQMVSYSKYQSVSISQEKLRYTLLNLDLEKQLMMESCDLFDPYTLSDELESMGAVITILEQRFGKLDSRVLEQKKMYTMLEVQHMLFVRDYNDRCGEPNYSIILFFYSNNEDYATAAERVGYVLGSFKNQNENVMIYSFDYDLVGSSLINLLKTKYEIIEQNTIIVGDEDKIVNLKNLRELEGYFE